LAKARTTATRSITTAKPTRIKLSRMLRVAVVAGAAALLAAPAWGALITRTATTATYKLTLSVGPVEKMYTAAEVKAKHPTSGEVMVGDSMSMDGMSMGAGNRHLEVQILSRATRKPLSIEPSVTLTDTSAMSGMAMSDKLHVMAMYGISEGRSDLHYGNNFKLTASHVYKVAVTVKGEKATFSFKA
jgi:hypothetical protein